MWWRRSPRDLAQVAHYEGVLGTSLEFQASARNHEAIAVAERAALAEIDRLEAIFSRYRENSELARWEAGEDFPPSPDLLRVLALADEWRTRTHGAFHPATEALTRLHRADSVDPAEIEQVVTKMREPLWTVEEEYAIRLTDLPANLNAIAKGYIVDRAAEAAFAVSGIDTVLVNIGGDLRHIGDKPITVAVVDPLRPSDNEAPLARVRLQGGGMATSGGYHRGRHLLDPRTGRPVERIVSASVLAPDALTADVLATAFSVLLPAESLTLADSVPGVALLVVDAEGRRFANPRWKEALLPLAA